MEALLVSLLVGLLLGRGSNTAIVLDTGVRLGVFLFTRKASVSKQARRRGGRATHLWRFVGHVAGKWATWMARP